MFEKVDDYTMKETIIENHDTFYILSELRGRLAVIKVQEKEVEVLIRKAEELGLIEKPEEI